MNQFPKPSNVVHSWTGDSSLLVRALLHFDFFVNLIDFRRETPRSWVHQGLFPGRNDNKSPHSPSLCWSFFFVSVRDLYLSSQQGANHIYIEQQAIDFHFSIIFQRPLYGMAQLIEGQWQLRWGCCICKKLEPVAKSSEARLNRFPRGFECYTNDPNCAHKACKECVIFYDFSQGGKWLYSR